MTKYKFAPLLGVVLALPATGVLAQTAQPAVGAQQTQSPPAQTPPQKADKDDQPAAVGDVVVSARAAATAASSWVRRLPISMTGRDPAAPVIRDAAEATAKSASAQVASARAAEYVARASLLAAMGQLEGPALNPTIEAYDPSDNYRAVRNRGALPWDGVIEAIDGAETRPTWLATSGRSDVITCSAASVAGSLGPGLSVSR